MNQRAFNLFTALISFILIGIASLLVVTMVQSESETTHILQELSEQARIEAILQTARSDAIQTVNFGIRSDIEAWLADSRNSLTPRPEDWDDWSALKASFARSQFGDVCSCKKPMELRTNDGKAYFSQFATCEQVELFCQDGDDHTIDETNIRRANFSKRVATHLQGLFQQWEIRYQGVLLRVENTDKRLLEDSLERLMKLSLQPAGAEGLDDDELAVRIGEGGVLASKGFFDVVGCEEPIDTDNPDAGVKMALNDECIGTFYINLKTSAFAQQFPELYEKLPVIVIEDTVSKRVIKDPILPGTDFRVFVPLRVFRALAIARRFAHDNTEAINTASDRGFLSPRFHNELDSMALGMCDAGICAPRTNPYLPPEVMHVDGTNFSAYTEQVSPSLACPGQTIKGGNQLSQVRITFRGNPDLEPYDPSSFEGSSKKLGELIRRRVCELSYETLANPNRPGFEPLLNEQGMRILTAPFGTSSGSPSGGFCNSFEFETDPDTGDILNLEEFTRGCCLLFNGFDTPETGTLKPYDVPSGEFTTVFAPSTTSKLLLKTTNDAKVERNTPKLFFSNTDPLPNSTATPQTCAPYGMPEGDLQSLLSGIAGMAGVQPNHRLGLWRVATVGKSAGEGLRKAPRLSGDLPVGRMGCSEDPADDSAKSIESMLADASHPAQTATEEGLKDSKNAGKCAELSELKVTLAIKEENPTYMVNRARMMQEPGLVYKIQFYDFGFTPFNPNWDQGRMHGARLGGVADFACEFTKGEPEPTNCSKNNFYGWTCMSLADPVDTDTYSGCYPPDFSQW